MLGLPTVWGTPSSDAVVQTIDNGQGGPDQKDRERMEEAALIRRCYTGDGLESDVTDTLMRRYHPDTFRQLKFDQGVSTHNMLMRDTVEKIAVEWQNGAEYSLIDANGEEVEEDTLAAFVSAMCLDNVILDVTKLIRIHRLIGVLPCAVLNEATGMRKFSLWIYTPENMTLIPSKYDRCGYAGVRLYGSHFDGQRRVYHRIDWTKDQYAEFESRDGKRYTEIDRQENPYGCIPVQMFQMQRSHDSPWGSSYGQQLAEKTVEVNCWETVLGFKGSSQIKVLGGQFSDWPAGQYLRDAGIVNYGDSDNTAILDFQTDLAGFANIMIERLRRQAAIAVGLGADEFDQTGIPPSGEALKMRYWKRDQQAMIIRNHVVESVQKLYWIALQVAWVEQKRTGQDDGHGRTLPPVENLPAKLPPYVEKNPDAFKFFCDPREVTYPELARDRQAMVDWQLQKGLISRAELMREQNPDLSEEQAEEQVRENLIAEADFNNPGRMALEVRKRNAQQALALGEGEVETEKKT